MEARPLLRQRERSQLSRRHHRQQAAADLQGWDRPLQHQVESWGDCTSSTVWIESSLGSARSDIHSDIIGWEKEDRSSKDLLVHTWTYSCFSAFCKLKIFGFRTVCHIRPSQQAKQKYLRVAALVYTIWCCRSVAEVGISAEYKIILWKSKSSEGEVTSGHVHLLLPFHFLSNIKDLSKIKC